MRSTIALALTMFSALPVMAQQQPQQQAYQPQQMVDAYGYPVYTPPQYHATQPPVQYQAPQPQLPAPAYTQPRPGEYGHSVINDIRQMNF
jgi:hypothetical protein